jgi:hypothetical protein
LEVPSHDNLINAPRVESIHFENILKEDGLENIAESKVEGYFHDIANANSYVVKLEEDTSRVVGEKTGKASDITLRANRPKYTDSVLVIDKPQNE